MLRGTPGFAEIQRKSGKGKTIEENKNGKGGSDLSMEWLAEGGRGWLEP